ncbi:MAG: hypothetical protein LBC18_00305, partial [Opitutaceae bacterium]|nr:hypothetical protein [Opitutaceae bacterium]
MRPPPIPSACPAVQVFEPDQDGIDRRRRRVKNHAPRKVQDYTGPKHWEHHGERGDEQQRPHAAPPAREYFEHLSTRPHGWKLAGAGRLEIRKSKYVSATSGA